MCVSVFMVPRAGWALFHRYRAHNAFLSAALASVRSVSCLKFRSEPHATSARIVANFGRITQRNSTSKPPEKGNAPRRTRIVGLLTSSLQCLLGHFYSSIRLHSHFGVSSLAFVSEMHSTVLPCRHWAFEALWQSRESAPPSHNADPSLSPRNLPLLFF